MKSKTTEQKLIDSMKIVSKMKFDHLTQTFVMPKEKTKVIRDKNYKPPKKRTPIVGEKHNALTLINDKPVYVQSEHGNTIKKYLFKCDCGNTKIIDYYGVIYGTTKSCGCYASTPLSRKLIKNKRLYNVYMGMKQRCLNPNRKEYADYGGRGIKMCKTWLNSYRKFEEWAFSHGYDENAEKFDCTIDRINNDRDYKPSNCRWVDMKVQNNNKRRKQRDDKSASRTDKHIISDSTSTQ